jgi:DnaJ-class molecular chaperone
VRTPRDPFSVLGIEIDATYEDAKGAYRRLAEIFHPDRFLDARDDVRAEAERQMQDLNAAWRTLRIRFGHEDDLLPAADDRRFRTDEVRRRVDERAASEWNASADFSTRARQARTRQRAQQRRSTTAEPTPDRPRPGTSERSRERQQREHDEREAFVREARERLLQEEEAQRRAQSDA